MERDQGMAERARVAWLAGAPDTTRLTSEIMADFALAEIRRAVREELESLRAHLMRGYAQGPYVALRAEIDRRLAALGGEKQSKVVGESRAGQPEQKAHADAPAGRSSSGAIAIARVVAERRRQVEAEGWTPEHDDEHGTGEMAIAAADYAMPKEWRNCTAGGTPKEWPWHQSSWKPTPNDRVRELEKAGALILAEIERLIRAGEDNGPEVPQETPRRREGNLPERSATPPALTEPEILERAAEIVTRECPAGGHRWMIKRAAELRASAAAPAQDWADRMARHATGRELWNDAGLAAFLRERLGPVVEMVARTGTDAAQAALRKMEGK